MVRLNAKCADGVVRFFSTDLEKNDWYVELQDNKFVLFVLDGAGERTKIDTFDDLEEACDMDII